MPNDTEQPRWERRLEKLILPATIAFLTLVVNATINKNSQEANKIAQDANLDARKAELDANLLDLFARYYYSNDANQKQFALNAIGLISKPELRSNLGRFVEQDPNASKKDIQKANNIAMPAEIEVLRNLLQSGDWRQADEATWRLLKASFTSSAGPANEQTIDLASIDKIPCVPLTSVNDLWKSYSNKKFGFSVQRDIWKKISGYPDYNSWIGFSEQVGWRINGRWIRYEEFSFSLNAPSGNLPTRGVGLLWDGKGWGLDRDKALMKRLEFCEQQELQRK